MKSLLLPKVGNRLRRSEWWWLSNLSASMKRSNFRGSRTLAYIELSKKFWKSHTFASMEWKKQSLEAIKVCAGRCRKNWRFSTQPWRRSCKLASMHTRKIQRWLCNTRSGHPICFQWSRNLRGRWLENTRLMCIVGNMRCSTKIIQVDVVVGVGRSRQSIFIWI